MCLCVFADSSPTPPQSNGVGNRSKRGRLPRKQFTPFDTEDHILYWVPRIHLNFAAEDPRVFAERLSRAYHLRETTEAYLRCVCVYLCVCLCVCVRVRVCVRACVSAQEGWPPTPSRYNLYVDCMPVEGVSEIDLAEVDRIVQLARSLTKLQTDRWALVRRGGEGSVCCILTVVHPSIVPWCVGVWSHVTLLSPSTACLACVGG